MPAYAPTMPPVANGAKLEPRDLRTVIEWAHRELRAVGAALVDPADKIHYITPYIADASLSAASKFNWKLPNAAIIRCSTSDTFTLTGFGFKIPKRSFTLINVGTGVLANKHEGTESSASYRLALPSALYQISANQSVTWWYDPSSSRHRPVSRT